MTEAQRFVGDNERGDREQDDFYATPSNATEALLSVEQFAGDIYEPCCGMGHITKVLENSGYTVESTDLRDRGFGTPNVDFLNETKPRDNIITNPPYKGAIKFIAKACEIAEQKVALLLPLRYLEGVERGDFYSHTPPARVWVFKRRIAMLKGGEDSGQALMAFAWFVFDKNHEGATEVGWI